MLKTKRKTDTEKLTEQIVAGMQEKKGIEVTVLDLRKLKNAIADYFIICSGNTETQVDAISQSIEEFVHKNLNIHPSHVEGKQNKEWVLIDYTDVVAHVFKKDRREFYGIEDLWGDAETFVYDK